MYWLTVGWELSSVCMLINNRSLSSLWYLKKESLNPWCTWDRRLYCDVLGTPLREAVPAPVSCLLLALISLLNNNVKHFPSTNRQLYALLSPLFMLPCFFISVLSLQTVIRLNNLKRYILLLIKPHTLRYGCVQPIMSASLYFHF